MKCNRTPRHISGNHVINSASKLEKQYTQQYIDVWHFGIILSDLSKTSYNRKLKPQVVCGWKHVHVRVMSTNNEFITNTKASTTRNILGTNITIHTHIFKMDPFIIVSLQYQSRNLDFNDRWLQTLSSYAYRHNTATPRPRPRHAARARRAHVYVWAAASYFK